MNLNHSITKLVILAGGMGSRLAEETSARPKPLVEIGGKPIIWHIMKNYAQFGITEFVICLGYKGYMIKEFFSNYFLHMSDVTFDLGNNSVEFHNKRAENWKITLVDTGIDTMTGGRLKRIAPYVQAAPFCMTYGDGVSDVNIAQLIQFHAQHGKAASVTVVQPPARFGAVKLDGTQVIGFEEKPIGEGGLINAGFFVLNPSVLALIPDDSTVWEGTPLAALAHQGELQAFQHTGFWQPMDTLRDKTQLEHLWQAGNAPWKNWA